MIIHETKFAGITPIEKYKSIKNTVLVNKPKYKDKKLALILPKLDDIACNFYLIL